MESAIIALVVAAIAAAIVYSYWWAAKRRAALSAWATAHGLMFSRDRDHGYDSQFPQFRCLRQGDNRYAQNVMTGSWGGRSAQCFDYHYETHSTDSKGRRQTQHHSFSVVIVQSLVPLEQMLIRPEGWLDKVSEFFGADDIDFESAEFSRKFFVKAANKRWAYDVIHQRTMEFLLSMPQYHMEFCGNSVMARRGEKMFDAAQYESALAVISGVLDRMPEYLVKQQTGT